MEKLLEMARKVADQAEVFLHEQSSSTLLIEDSKPTEMESSIQTGYAIRVIKDGKDPSGKYYAKIKRFGIWFWLTSNDGISLFRRNREYYLHVHRWVEEIDDFHIRQFQAVSNEVVLEINKKKQR